MATDMKMTDMKLKNNKYIDENRLHYNTVRKSFFKTTAEHKSLQQGTDTQLENILRIE